MAIKLFGDSHLNVIEIAARAHEMEWQFHWTTGKHLPDMIVADIDGGVHVTIPDDTGAPQVSLDLLREDWVFFSGPFHTSRMARNPAWLTHIPQSLYTGGDALVVCDAEIHAYVDAYFAQVFDSLQVIRKAGVNICVIEAPKLLPRVAEFWGGDTAVVAEVDRVLRDHVRSRLRSLIVPVLKTPDHTHDGRWTLPEFASKKSRDVHHGNRRYGMNVVRRVQARLDRLADPDG